VVALSPPCGRVVALSPPCGRVVALSPRCGRVVAFRHIEKHLACLKVTWSLTITPTCHDRQSPF
jgi:hypothetical protein